MPLTHLSDTIVRNIWKLSSRSARKVGYDTVNTHIQKLLLLAWMVDDPYMNFQAPIVRRIDKPLSDQSESVSLFGYLQRCRVRAV
jgi:hypothetical protein